MARLYDSNGNPLGGLNTGKRDSRPDGHTGATPEAAAPADYLSPQPPATPFNRRYGPEETIPGLECSYGTFAYSYSQLPADNVSARSRRPGCHNPVEKPEERRHCDVCGGDYCSVHAGRTAHDCDSITLPES